MVFLHCFSADEFVIILSRTGFFSLADEEHASCMNRGGGGAVSLTFFFFFKKLNV